MTEETRLRGLNRLDFVNFSNLIEQDTSVRDLSPPDPSAPPASGRPASRWTRPSTTRTTTSSLGSPAQTARTSPGKRGTPANGRTSESRNKLISFHK